MHSSLALQSVSVSTNVRVPFRRALRFLLVAKAAPEPDTDRHNLHRGLGWCRQTTRDSGSGNGYPIMRSSPWIRGARQRRSPQRINGALARLGDVMLREAKLSFKADKQMPYVKSGTHSLADLIHFNHAPLPQGQRAPYSGIYRCVNCGYEIACAADNNLPVWSNDPRHEQWNCSSGGLVKWQVVALATSESSMRTRQRLDRLCQRSVPEERKSGLARRLNLIGISPFPTAAFRRSPSARAFRCPARRARRNGRDALSHPLGER
jgi:hypothetical protein